MSRPLRSCCVPTVGRFSNYEVTGPIRVGIAPVIAIAVAAFMAFWLLWVITPLVVCLALMLFDAAGCIRPNNQNQYKP